MIVLKPEKYNDVRGCNEYQPYLLFKTKERNTFWIDMEKIPKEHYLPINGNYVDGLIFCNQLNDATEDHFGLIGVTYG